MAKATGGVYRCRRATPPCPAWSLRLAKRLPCQGAAHCPLPAAPLGSYLARCESWAFSFRQTCPDLRANAWTGQLRSASLGRAEASTLDLIHCRLALVTFWYQVSRAFTGSAAQQMFDPLSKPPLCHPVVSDGSEGHLVYGRYLIIEVRLVCRLENSFRA